MFIKKENLHLINGGYLATEETPVTHCEFVKAQRRANYLVKLAEEVSKATFEKTEVDCFDAIAKRVCTEVNAVNVHTYVETPEAPKQKISDSLTAEAMAFLKFQEEKTTSEKVNHLMQPFNVLKSFEEFGLYFEKGLVKIVKIYTVEEVLEAIKVLEPHLD